MIYLNFRIDNPFHKNNFKNLFNYNKQLTTNKIFEFELLFSDFSLLSFELSTKFKGEDHAGPYFSLEILGLSLNFKIYDNRHWDDDNDRWMNYE